MDYKKMVYFAFLYNLNPLSIFRPKMPAVAWDLLEYTGKALSSQLDTLWRYVDINVAFQYASYDDKPT